MPRESASACPGSRACAAGSRISPSPDTSACCSPRPRGYCAGVDRAVIAVEKALEHYGAPGLRAQADRAQHPRRHRARAAGRDLRRRGRRGARGRPHRLQRARRLARGRERGRRPGPARHRRDLPARHQGAPRGRALRARRLRDPAHRPRGPRRGRGHRRRGARPRHPRRQPRRRAEHRGARPRQGRVALADHALGRRDHGDGAPPARAVPEPRRTRPATTSATPPRTARSRSRRSRRTPTS